MTLYTTLLAKTSPKAPSPSRTNAANRPRDLQAADEVFRKMRESAIARTGSSTIPEGFQVENDYVEGLRRDVQYRIDHKLPSDEINEWMVGLLKQIDDMANKCTPAEASKPLSPIAIADSARSRRNLDAEQQVSTAVEITQAHHA